MKESRVSFHNLVIGLAHHYSELQLTNVTVQNCVSYTKGQLYIKSGQMFVIVTSGLFQNNIGRIGEADLYIAEAISVIIEHTSFLSSRSGNTDTGISITMLHERNSYFPVNMKN